MPSRPPVHRPFRLKSRADYDRERGSAAARGYNDARWHELRRRVIERDRTCRECRARPAEVAAHIVPRKLGGADDWANLRGLCFGCHSRESAMRGESLPRAD